MVGDMTRPVGVLALRIWRNEANQPRQGERQPRHRRLDRAGDLALLVDREARHRPDCDPFDLTDIDVRHKGKPAGKAVPFIIGRHRPAKTRTGDQEQRAEPEPTGIDYLKILDHAYGQDLQAQIN